MATDPVCGMYVDEATAELVLRRDNRAYYFCSSSCLAAFAAPEAEAAHLRRALLVAWPCSVAVLVLTYLGTGIGAAWAAAGLAAVVQAYPGAVFYRGTRDAIRSRLWNMDVLIAVGTTAAFAYSVAVLALPGRLPSTTYFDASSLIVALILTGTALERTTRARAAGALRALGQLVPTRAIRVVDGRPALVEVATLAPGDRVRVTAGERFPVDGEVVAGSSFVDEALATGESVPVSKGPGALVLAGTTNGTGVLEVRTTRTGSDTFVAEVGRLLGEAEMSALPWKRTADRLAEGFVPFVLAVAIGAAVVWLAVGAGPTIALLVFVTVAITACPCAFGLATPAAVAVATGAAADRGILFRGRNALERTAEIGVVAFDKTGTLSSGTPELDAVVPIRGGDPAAVLRVAAALESSSGHPLARAVVAGAQRRALAIPLAEGVGERAGAGIAGTVDGRRIEVGRLEPDPTVRLPDELRAEAVRADALGATVAVVRDGGTPIGVLTFVDRLDTSARDAVSRLTELGVEVELLSGDREAAVAAAAQAVGIRRWGSGMTPAAKLARLSELRRGGRTVAMVGDGINDAPALVGADVGVALGTGSEVAREAGALLLVRHDLTGVPAAIDIARATLRQVRRNLLWAVGYNAVLLPVAAGALVPAFGLGIYAVLPIAGAAAMAISSTTVVGGSLLLRRTLRTATRRSRPVPSVGGARAA